MARDARAARAGMTLSPARPIGPDDAEPAIRLRDVRHAYRGRLALCGVTEDIPAGRLTGLIGPDGVGKSSLLALISGARALQSGEVIVLGADMREARAREATCSRIAYMPQGLGKNLYPTLSVFENIDFFGRLFGHDRAERLRRIGYLTESTGLAPFIDRAAGKLSGGMRQKLGLCCALIHDPDLLVLDEPTTGIDPLSRRQFWEMISRIRAERPGMTVLVATAYMEEAARFDWLIAMDGGRVLARDTPRRMLERFGARSLEAAFVSMLPDERKRGHVALSIPPRTASGPVEIAIEAQGLTKRFGDFIAVDRVGFRIERGEIFGFLGSNGCGKTTTMKMLTGLLPASEGHARLFGSPADATDLETRRRVGYMTQSFSLYGELTVRQNLELHARLFRVPDAEIRSRVADSMRRFELLALADSLPGSMPLGQRQRLSLAVALIHRPEILILDEPTSGVDPLARDAFWREMVDLSRRDGVTIFISTHFMDEAARCDRVSFMHAGRVLESGSPAELVERRGVASLEDAFISCLEDAVAVSESVTASRVAPIEASQERPAGGSSLRRLLSYSRREALELRRDPIRMTLAGLGTVLLLFIMGYGISMDVEDLTFSVLDRDQTSQSRGYALEFAGSRYFREQAPIVDDSDLDRRMRAGGLALAIEIPPGFGRDVARGHPVEIAAWIDGGMPMRAETVRSYVQAMHASWLANREVRRVGGEAAGLARLETRFRYNPDVESLTAMVPAVIPLLLLLIPSMLCALSVVREKELGSIVNFYVTPVRRLEFLIGKQLPYVVLAFSNFLLLTLLAVTVFSVPLKGSFATLAFAAVLYSGAATAMGLLISSFVRSQVGGIFGTAVLTMLPTIQFSGLLDPVSTLEGLGAWIGRIYPATHYLTISRGVFSKALDFSDLVASFVPLAAATPILLALCVVLLKKQET